MSTPGPTRPTAGAPRSTGPRRAYLLAGLIALVGLLGAGAWASLALLAEVHRPAGFERIATPGEGQVQLDEKATRVVFAERAGSLEPSQITVTGPDGVAIPLQPYRGDLRYDVPGSDSAVGTAVATFTAPTAGTYRVGSATFDGTLAVGPDLAAGTVRALTWPSLAGLVALAVGVAIAVRATARHTPGA